MTDSGAAPAVSGYLERHGLLNAQVVALTGDASDRRYFRVRPRDGSSFVLAVHTAPFDYTALPFVNVAELLAKMPVPIPQVRGHAADLGVLALDDLGDVTLQAHLGAAPHSTWRSFYEEAISYIAVIQRRGRVLEDLRFVPYGIAFDVDKLMWEFDFFIKHFLEAYRGAVFTLPERDALREECRAIATELASEPRVLCHRDYHSRNLMLHGGHLYIIDFQDARMGPAAYDLVSLLRDSYVDLPESMVDTLIDVFVRASGSPLDSKAFRLRFDVMALQRNTKALGTFGYQATAKGNPVYTQYIPRTLRYVRNNLAQHDRFGRLAELLSPHLGEFRS